MREKFKLKGFAPIILILVITASAITVGGGSYAGITHYQSNKLIGEADNLVKEGKYSDALAKYDKAERKWRWAKIESKKTDAIELNQLQEYNIQGDNYFGKGEWQKCLEFLGKVTPRFPNYEDARARYSDCEKKLAEKQAAEAQAAKAPTPESQKETVKSTEPQKQTIADPTNNQEEAATEPTGAATNEEAADSAPPPSVSNDQPVAQTRPTLYLPFSTSLLPDSIVPMGETIFHPKPQNPQGHGGIDFQWSNPSQTVNILASIDGEVTGIKDNTSHTGTYDLSTKNGRYRVTYTEMEIVNSNLKVGDQVKVGDYIGNPQHPAAVTDQPNFRMIHWEFGYHSEYDPFWGDRLCPLTYFTASAKSTLETIWADLVWLELKANAPDLCSGDYAGKDE